MTTSTSASLVTFAMDNFAIVNARAGAPPDRIAVAAEERVAMNANAEADDAREGWVAGA